ncbi:MBL fold metallo-hydrolase [Brevibacillus choshinensis]|uniref:MBL fold metallo-hydrolase n=1 Tax=Brevibacillus choshinensis TaxID=54911 RepID=UPI002E1D83D7|nr:MBL fold metallo-hydrolase [Brevibacillus choshinensis]
MKLTTTFAKGNVNAFILPQSPVTLVDTGTHLPTSIQELREGMNEAGFSFRDLEQIVVTHMHTDHYGGVQTILQENNIPVYVHEQAKKTLASGEKEFLQTEEFMHSFIKDCGAAHILTRNRKYREEAWGEVRYLEDGDTLAAGGRDWKIIYTPGHSQSDICLWDQISGDVIVGDFLLQEISANAFIVPPDSAKRERPKPLLQMRESFQRVYDLPFGTIYPGHGAPFTDHRQLIDQRRREQAERCDKITILLADQPRNVMQICKELFPWLQDNALFLGLSEVQGHLDLLQEQSRVLREQRDGVMWYYAVQTNEEVGRR